MEKLDLTAVILTRNEEKNIARAITSVSFCREVIIIDDGSQDHTVKIAKKHKVKVIQHPLRNNFAAQKNYALSQVKTSWALFLDADEVVKPALRREIINKLKGNNQVNGYYLPRRDIFWGREVRFGETAVNILRLAKKGKGRWTRRVHETWRIRGETGTFRNFLYHYPHPTLSEFVEHVNFYSTLHAQANQREGKKSSWFKILLYPLIKFADGYIGRLGFLDGFAGFTIAVMMSFHSFLAWSKLWYKQKK